MRHDRVGGVKEEHHDTGDEKRQAILQRERLVEFVGGSALEEPGGQPESRADQEQSPSWAEGQSSRVMARHGNPQDMQGNKTITSSAVPTVGASSGVT